MLDRPRRCYLDRDPVVRERNGLSISFSRSKPQNESSGFSGSLQSRMCSTSRAELTLVTRVGVDQYGTDGSCSLRRRLNSLCGDYPSIRVQVEAEKHTTSKAASREFLRVALRQRGGEFLRIQRIGKSAQPHPLCSRCRIERLISHGHSSIRR